ncbi:hypothetical protein HanRHA438_Chr15g0683771 [Helianthus annuus]|nr:hypothetical protein HanRHA438_Chr15g0683771 [Helianthus annuus]
MNFDGCEKHASRQGLRFVGTLCSWDNRFLEEKKKSTRGMSLKIRCIRFFLLLIFS